MLEFKGSVPFTEHKLPRLICMDRTVIQELASEGPHMISADTSKRLRRELNLVGEKPRRVAYAGQRLAESTFTFLNNNDPKTFGVLYEWLSEAYEEAPDIEGLDRMDAATMGMGVVLQAFSLQYGPSFYDGLRGVDLSIKEEGLGSLAPEDRSILGRVARKSSAIEPFQTHLGGVIDDFERYIGYPNEMKEGATAAYNMVRFSWDQLHLSK